MVGAGGLCRFSGRGGGGGLNVETLPPMLLLPPIPPRAEERTLEDKTTDGVVGLLDDTLLLLDVRDEMEGARSRLPSVIIAVWSDTALECPNAAASLDLMFPTENSAYNYKWDKDLNDR